MARNKHPEETEQRILDAAGRLFLAAMNEREVDAVVQENGLPDGGDWEGVNTRAALDAELKKIRASGYAIRETTDLVAVSCPVHQGGALAARLPFDVLERATQRIRTEVRGITRVVYDLTPSAHYGELE